MTLALFKKCTTGLLLLASVGLQPATAIDIVSYGKDGVSHESVLSTIGLMPFMRTGAVVRNREGGVQDTGINVSTQITAPAGVFCHKNPLTTRTNSLMYNSLSPVGSSKAPDGGTLFATEKPGFYYTLKITSMASPGSGITYTNGEFFVDNSAGGQLVMGTVSDRDLCDGTSKPLNLSLNIHYYSDSTFNSPVFPGGGIAVDDYLIRFKGGNNPTDVKLGNSGTGLFFINQSKVDGKYLGIELLNTAITISQPTCFGQVVDGNGWNATDNTVELGTYKTTDIQNGTAPAHDFKITLTNCLGIDRIEVRLKGNGNVSQKDRFLLRNVYGSAYGVALKISGKANTYYPAAELQPDNTLSVYKAFEDEKNTDSYIDYSSVSGFYSGTQQPLEFSAQLVPDGPDATVRGGSFNTSATLSITYP